MIKKYLKSTFFSKDLYLIPDKTERFVVLMNDFKQIMGAWYSILALRIFPVILFIVPINVVLARINHFIQMHFLPDFYWDGPILMVMWALGIAALLLLAILVPKAASVYEFAFGFAYLFFVFKKHLYNTPVGIALMTVMILYLLVKLFFLVVKTIGKVKFSHDPKNVERDESGRIVRKASEDVFFVKTEEHKIIDGSRPASSADNDFFFEKIEDKGPAAPNAARAAADDDFFFEKIKDNSPAAPNAARAISDDDFFIGRVEDTVPKNTNTARKASDDDFFIGRVEDTIPKAPKKSKKNKNQPISGSDDDYFFG